MSTATRPAVIEQYIQATHVKKKAEALLKSLKPACTEYLKSSDYDGIKYSESTKEEYNGELIAKWAFENLEREDYESLFVKVFDVNQLSILMQQGKVVKEALPEGSITEVITPRITVK